MERYEILVNEDGVIYLDLGLDPKYFMSDCPDGEPHPFLFIVYREEISEEREAFPSIPRCWKNTA